MTAPDRLRALLAEPGFVVMPAVWDGLTARLTAAAGFKTAFLSGSCVAASRLGGPDLDLVSFGEMFDSFNMVHGAAPDLLILADGDHGYGNAMNVQRTVRAYGRAGAAAILIEDKITPRALTAAGTPCLPRAEARMKIRAAAAAGRPSFAVLSPGAPRATPSQAQAAALGFKIGTYPTGLLAPAAAGMKAGLAALASGEAGAATAMPPPELRTTLGYPDYDAAAKPFIVPG